MDSQQAVPDGAADRTIHLAGLLIGKFDPQSFDCSVWERVTLRWDVGREELMLEQTYLTCHLPL